MANFSVSSETPFVFYRNFYGLTNISKSKKKNQFTKFPFKQISFLTHFPEGGNLKPLGQLELEYNLTNVMRFLAYEKLTSKELYSILILEFSNKPSYFFYFEKLFPYMEFDWSGIYILTCKRTINKYSCSFQYKILSNMFF